ncbi:MAG: fumarylacetoacetase [Flavobacteriaceae bacterium]|nr:fumarylacetoacetase [Flavobacteriaceae bacterium]
MQITANNPAKKSWLSVDKQSDFPIQNIPFGVFITKDDLVTIGTRIGEYAIDLAAMHQLGYFEGIELTDDIFLQDTLNDFISHGKKCWRQVRNRIAHIFDQENGTLQNNKKHKDIILFDVNEIEVQLPVNIGDYTDFYSSRDHATNVGKMFRDPDNALLPNWLHIPVGYHGRSSSIVVSGTPIHRPKGQTFPKDATSPQFGPSKLIDFELEMGFITTDANHLGDTIDVDDAESYIFGMVLFNDWSARDIQKWEYVPLGPFLAKNFASTISPWIVTMDALEPFRVELAPQTDPKPFAYLQEKRHTSFDIHLETFIETENGDLNKMCSSNFKHMYWSMAQQLAHHTVNGCNVNSGDMFGSGTISGPNEGSYGSMLEIAWQGTKPVQLKDGTERKFINDHDHVIMRGYCEKDGVRIGFGKCTGKILPTK